MNIGIFVRKKGFCGAEYFRGCGQGGGLGKFHSSGKSYQKKNHARYLSNDVSPSPPDSCIHLISKGYFITLYPTVGTSKAHIL